MKYNKVLILAACSVMAVLLFMLENILPKPFPFFRIGLANVFILLILVNMDFKSAIIIALTKVVLGNLFSGLLFTPIVLLSLLGSVAACIIMYIGIKARLGLSLVGLSILGAVFHNLVQLTVAYFILIKSVRLFSLVPVMLVLALITGIITGSIASLLKDKFILVAAPKVAK
ncbi:MAG: Gx transporter family protein [Candidatus Cloacimonadia bacterium]